METSVFKKHTCETNITWKKFIFAHFICTDNQLKGVENGFYMHSSVHEAWPRTDLLDGICSEPRDENNLRCFTCKG